MWFWIVAAGMTAAAAFALARPLLKGAGPLTARREFDLEVYRSQLAELERDAERGLISPQQAASAKAEIGRRALALSGVKEGAKEGGGDAARKNPSRINKIAAALLLALIPIGALTVYLPLGAPDLPARPLASRNIEKERNAPPPAVLAAVGKLKEELAKNPDNLQGWTVLARTLSRMAEWGEAGEALKNVLRLSPNDVDAKAAYAEALVNVGDGKVGADVVKLLNEVRAAAPQDPRPAYYMALARSQQGDLKGALADWQAQMAVTPADAPWLPLLKGKIEETASKLGLDVASATPQPAPPAQPVQADGDSGNGGGANGGGVNGGERQAMIESMVRRLEERLAGAPDDVDGWVRLARSYRVMGKPEKALDAARQAVQRGPNQAAAHLALADALLGGNGQEELPSPLPGEVEHALRTVLTLDPANRDALWLLGSDAARQSRKQEAAQLWGRLLAQLEAGSSDYAFVKERIDALK